MDSTEDAGAAAELTRLVLDELGPALRWYHAEVARSRGEWDWTPWSCSASISWNVMASRPAVSSATGRD